MNSAYQTSSGFYYVFDEQVQTCFGFDPRDELKRPLARLLPQENAPRHLQGQSCSDAGDCFTCEGASAGLCTWEDNRCKNTESSQPLDINNMSGNNWFTSYKDCPDHLRLCQRQSQNKTFWDFTMDFNSYTERDYIPNNYFCKFSAPLLDDEISW